MAAEVFVFGRILVLLALMLLAGYLLVLVLRGVFAVLHGLFRGIAWVFRGVFGGFGRLGRFIRHTLRDLLQLAGAVFTCLFYVPTILAQVALGRWEKANHYGRALEQECLDMTTCAYRLAIGNVAHLFGLTALTDGIERRVPEVIARAPTGPGGGPPPGSFAGYRVVGTLPAGGSGARLYLADVEPDKRRALEAAGRVVPAQVVIKSFSHEEGSSLPQIVRENRALAAARDLGLVLEHELSPRRFHYVMPYVPGEDLGRAAAVLHSHAGPEGLDAAGLARVLGWTADLLGTLDGFHGRGLWHKDVKPGNVIVAPDGRVHLVDLGLLTPLASALTLTTHGTEYFRDPEMVRLALRGVRVHEVDGVKFDIYGTGAVLYALVENSFPAHGSLSQISRRCPEALKWIVRRAMADMNSRYASAAQMLADVQALAQAPDPFAFKPAALPSMGGQPPTATAPFTRPSPTGLPGGPLPGAPAAAPAAGLPLGTGAPAAPPAAPRRSGRRTLVGAAAAGAFLFLSLIWFARAQTGPDGSDSTGVSALLQSFGIGSGDFDVPRQRHFMVLPAANLEQRLAVQPAAHTTSRAVEPDLSVLLLDDLASLASLDAREQLDALFLRLREGGAALLDGRREAPAPLDVDAQLSLLAGARAAIGLSDPADPQALSQLQDWLAAAPAALDGVLWIAGGADGPAQVRLLTRDTAREQRLSKLLQ